LHACRRAAAFSIASPVWPYSQNAAAELNDRRVGPVPDGVENGLHTLIETQQARGEIVRGRHRSCVVAGDLEAAGVFHEPILNLERLPAQKRAFGSSKYRHTDSVEYRQEGPHV
jgi:hypothetical protein